jgi:hypothetical protein
VLLMTDAIKVAIEHTSSDPVEVFLPYVNRKFRGASTASFSRSQALPACFRPSGRLLCRLGQCCSYVKTGLALSVLKTTRASCRFRQRIASRRLFPSACLRSR